MLKIQTLDTTLRDGGLRNGHQFGEAFSEEVVSRLDLLRLDYIEFSLSIAKNRKPDDYSFLNKIRKAAKNSKLAMMCMGGMTTLNDLKHIQASGMDLVRVVFMNDADPVCALDLLRQAKNIGLEVSANITSTMHWSVEAMTALIPRVLEAGADIIYIADSCGGMTPNDVRERLNIIKLAKPKRMGFHAHDNLGMALLNCVTAVEQGAEMIDCSLRGMGKGCGNLKTEIWLSYLNKMQGYHYDMPKLLALTDDFERQIPEAHPVQSSQQVMLGYLDLSESPERLANIEQLMKQEELSWFEAARQLNRFKK